MTPSNLLPTETLNLIKKELPEIAHKIIYIIYHEYGYIECKQDTYDANGIVIGVENIGTYKDDNDNTISDFISNNVEYDINNPNYWNSCVIEVFSTGEYYIDYSFVEEFDSMDDFSVRRIKQYELYIKRKSCNLVNLRTETDHSKKTKKSADKKTDIDVKTEIDNVSTKKYTLPELLGFIISEYKLDIPDCWSFVHVEVSIKHIDNQTHVNAVSSYSSIDVENQKFTPSNSIGTMNAFIKIKDIMQDEGNKWSKANFIFKPDGLAKIDVKDA